MKNNYQYRDLSLDQIKSANGCGSSHWLACLFRLPRFLFPQISKACDCHDIGYAETGPEIEIKWALDAQLVEDIREVARRGNWLEYRWKMRVAALVEWCLNTNLSEVCWRAAKR